VKIGTPVTPAKVVVVVVNGSYSAAPYSSPDRECITKRQLTKKERWHQFQLQVRSQDKICNAACCEDSMINCDVHPEIFTLHKIVFTSCWKVWYSQRQMYETEIFLRRCQTAIYSLYRYINIFSLQASVTLEVKYNLIFTSCLQ